MATVHLSSSFGVSLLLHIDFFLNVKQNDAGVVILAVPLVNVTTHNLSTNPVLLLLHETDAVCSLQLLLLTL